MACWIVDDGRAEVKRKSSGWIGMDFVHFVRFVSIQGLCVVEGEVLGGEWLPFWKSENQVQLSCKLGGTTNEWGEKVNSNTQKKTLFRIIFPFSPPVCLLCFWQTREREREREGGCNKKEILLPNRNWPTNESRLFCCVSETTPPTTTTNNRQLSSAQQWWCAWRSTAAVDRKLQSIHLLHLLDWRWKWKTFPPATSFGVAESS